MSLSFYVGIFVFFFFLTLVGIFLSAIESWWRFLN